VAHLRQKLNIDVNSFWVKTVLQLVEHNVNDNCYITYGGLTRLLVVPLQGAHFFQIAPPALPLSVAVAGDPTWPRIYRSTMATLQGVCDT
jgi:hypothetical protein